MLSAASCNISGIDSDLFDELAAIGRPTSLVAQRPQIVADVNAQHPQISQENKENRRDHGAVGQCADPTPSSIPLRQFAHAQAEVVHPAKSTGSGLPSLSSSLGKKRESPVPSIAVRKANSFIRSTTPYRPRKPRRMSAYLDRVAGKKTWGGTKSKGRKDKLNPTEKFVAAIWSAAAANGVKVSLNLGIRREGMLIDHDNPRRRMMQNLQSHLSASGFGKLPYAFVFETTNEDDGNRLHLHGVMDTSGLSRDDLARLGKALRNAASYASGAIGGERQLDTGPLYDAPGWSDYLLKSATRTAREMGIDDPFMMNNPMKQAARRYFDGLRAETGGRQKAAPQPLRKPDSTSSTSTKIPQNGFTVRSGSVIKSRSGERDAKLAGGVPSDAYHRPQQADPRRAPGRSASPLALQSQPPGLHSSVPPSSTAAKCLNVWSDTDWHAQPRRLTETRYAAGARPLGAIRLAEPEGLPVTRSGALRG